MKLEDVNNIHILRGILAKTFQDINIIEDGVDDESVDCLIAHSLREMISIIILAIHDPKLFSELRESIDKLYSLAKTTGSDSIIRIIEDMIEVDGCIKQDHIKKMIEEYDMLTRP